MGTRAPRGATNEEATFQKLAEDLRLETSPQTIFNCLKALKKGLSDPHTAGHRARIFLRAGGLPPLIRHLMGTPTSSQTQDSRIDPSDISDEAARALSQLLGPEETSPELRCSAFTTIFILIIIVVIVIIVIVITFYSPLGATQAIRLCSSFEHLDNH